MTRGDGRNHPSTNPSIFAISSLVLSNNSRASFASYSRVGSVTSPYSISAYSDLSRLGYNSARRLANSVAKGRVG